MLELYQFELSQYSEKVRLILDYKGLNYRKIEVTPGIGQVELFRLTGQRQVPVLKDGIRYIADSTEIAKYLDLEYPERPLLPKNSKQRGHTLLIEEWADESIGTKSRKAFFSAISQNQNLRKSLLPTTTPDILKTVVQGVPSELLQIMGLGVGYTPDAIRSAIADLKQDLEALTLLLADSPYLTGDEPTLADFAVAGLSLLLKFPDGPYLDLPATLSGQGVPLFAENPAYEPFFSWRDRLYAQFRKPLLSSTAPTSPTSIQIE
ncbi:glutathione S-transferase [Scytonema sp. UIC 10036]|uniref:glutathione S-transferase family protein n=1 Tax=Scytonema sp. UIC 10036 TaxID=2304196 RepID=UPI0012DAB18B|nr:glutathione S-transferase family protein [Scytonema sp. UIC 10036]MUH00199.1 glutathione S-transferase [Scytonema sp. UIC 10036]